MEVFSNRSTDIAAYYAKVVSSINMEGDDIDFVIKLCMWAFSDLHLASFLTCLPESVLTENH